MISREKSGVPDGARVDRASSPVPKSGEPQWQSPRDAVKKMEAKPLHARAIDALKEAGINNPSDKLVAALILAQAIDRLGARIIEAAAVSRYHGA